MRVAMLLVLLLSTVSFAQSEPASFENDMEHAYKNAKKGIYWAMSNIPDSKSKLTSDLIAEDKLIANISIDKEVEGIKFEARGYYNTYEIEIKIYRSNDSLKKDGYL